MEAAELHQSVDGDERGPPRQSQKNKALVFSCCRREGGGFAKKEGEVAIPIQLMTQ